MGYGLRDAKGNRCVWPDLGSLGKENARIPDGIRAGDTEHQYTQEARKRCPKEVSVPTIGTMAFSESGDDFVLCLFSMIK